ncbi:hypothetical protein QN277_023117 [Acacia crassicarpa]|uniref:AT-hook motif nuclear-localized protein n=1 Tax=Acacia crassicarpa TaxID=499986 RepID=A0AAE1JL28_9FABA|nr:hypothetical protein QN277_023117 [Acacia crassicarpa]
MDSREPPQSSPPSRIDSPKTGRPRKYSPDGTILSPTPLSSYAPADLNPTSDEPPARKSRGRPTGSGKKQLDALGVGGRHLPPHLILVNRGEDIAAKITSFCEEGPRLVCILSACGAVSSATLRLPTRGTVSYEGRYQIISLSGAFNPFEDEGGFGTSGMSVALAGADGKLVGGSVCGMLVAASEIQIVVGSFIVEGKKKSSPNEKSGPSPAETPSGSQVVNSGTSPLTPTSAKSQGVSRNLDLNLDPNSGTGTNSGTVREPDS